MPTILIVFGLVILVGGGLAFAGLLYSIYSRSEVEDRLEAFAVVTDAVPVLIQRKPNIPVNRIRMRVNNMLSAFISDELSLQLISANWPIMETEFVLIRIWGTIAGFFLGWLLLRSPISGAGLALLAFMVPPILLRRSIHQRRTRFENQLIDVLVLMTGAVRAGYSLPQSLEFIVKEINAPASEEFRRVLYEISLGLPLNEALQNLVRRMENDDLYLLVTAININSQVGGNLVTMLQSVTSTIRERIRLFGEIRAITSQQRYNGYILTLLPFGFAAIMFVLNPEYIQKLFLPGINLCFPVGAVVFVIIGNLIVRRMVRIKV